MQHSDSQNAPWVRGEVQWTGAGLAEAFAILPSVRNPQAAVQPDSGAPIADASATNEIVWLIGRYGEAAGRAHALRLFQVRRFLVGYKLRLLDEGLIHEGTESGGFVLTPGLTRALATLPYSRHVWDAATGTGEATLDVDDVVEAAHAMDDPESAEP